MNRQRKLKLVICGIVLICVVALGACFLADTFSSKSLSGKLGVSMDMAVTEHESTAHSDGHFIATDYDVMRVTKEKDETIVYAWVFYAEYSFDGSDVRKETASHIPTVVTFDTSDDSDSSTYDVIEYWIPGDGSEYAEDIREKFPLALQAKALDTSGAERQEEKCLQAAREYYGVGVAPEDSSTVEGYVTRVDTDNGLILICYDPENISNADYLGDCCIPVEEGTLISEGRTLESIEPGEHIIATYTGTLAETFPAEIDGTVLIQFVR